MHSIGYSIDMSEAREVIQVEQSDDTSLTREKMHYENKLALAKLEIRFDARMHLIEESHRSLLAKVEENTNLTRQVNANTSDLVVLFSNAKAGARFFMWLANFAKAVAALIVALSIIGGLFTVVKSYFGPFR